MDFCKTVGTSVDLYLLHIQNMTKYWTVKRWNSVGQVFVWVHLGVKDGYDFIIVIKTVNLGNL